MTLALDTLSRKALVAALAVLVTASLSLPLYSHFRAAQLSRPGTREGLEAALRLQPGNAELHNRLGRVLLYSPQGDPGLATAELRRAAELNPRSGAFWADLAMALELEGDGPGAAAAILEARRAEPRSPSILWQEANFELRVGNMPRALELLRELMQQSPDYTSRVLPLFSRVIEPRELVANVVPPTRPALDAALDFIRREDHLAAAPAAWQRVLNAPDPPVQQLPHFVDWLLRRGESELALRVWRTAAERKWISVPLEALQEPMYNADFRYPLQNFGFDWRVAPHPEASIWMEAGGPEPGMTSLCVQFNEGARAGYGHLFHYVSVKPGFHYSLRGAMRSDRLVSRAGAFFQIREPLSGRILGRAEGVDGTSSWRDVVLPVETDADTSLLQVVLMRSAPIAGEEAASGLVCIAALRWEELGPAAALGKP